MDSLELIELRRKPAPRIAPEDRRLLGELDARLGTDFLVATALEFHGWHACLATRIDGAACVLHQHHDLGPLRVDVALTTALGELGIIPAAGRQ